VHARVGDFFRTDRLGEKREEEIGGLLLVPSILAIIILFNTCALKSGK
jgi:hypothetical protein